MRVNWKSEVYNNFVDYSLKVSIVFVTVHVLGLFLRRKVF